MTSNEAVLRARLEAVQRDLEEANETLDAIRNGEVDAVVVGGPAGQFVYTLENADRPYRVLVEEMQEGAVTLNGDGLILYCNRSFGRLAGRGVGALVGTSLFDHVGSAGLVRRMLDHETAMSAELILHAVGGRQVPVNLSIVELRVEENAQRMLCGIVTDLSSNYARTNELTQAHARLAERTAELETSEARLRAVFDTSFQFQGLLDPDGKVLAANDVSLVAIQSTLDEVRGRHYWETPWFSATPGMPDIIAAAIDTIRAGGAAIRTELQVLLPTDGWRSLDFSLRPIRDAAGNLRAMVPEAADLTDIRQAEEALRQAQKLDAIGQLTGSVAHDFNNLLTVIRGSVELLQRPQVPEEKRRRYIDAIGETAIRATKLTGQLLSFARRQALKPELFDIGTSIESVRAIVASLTGARIQLETQAPEQPCFVLADRSQFDTAIVNMAINARDAIDGEGRIGITIKAVSGYPAGRSHAAMKGDFVAIAVSDTGKGIASEDLDRIFEPFFTTKEVGAGTGLGLSQVIGFAKQSDGEITVESVVGAGTLFTLYLPRAKAADAAAQYPMTPDTAAAGDGIRVLIVEDNGDVGDFATHALGELGYDSLLAANASEALALLQDDCSRFHIVFSDVIMPGISGIELAEHIRRRYPRMPVILTSGYSEVLAHSGSHGFELLHKPYSIDELSRVIRKVLAVSAG